MTYNGVSLKDTASGCQASGPDFSLFRCLGNSVVAEAIRLGCRVVSVVARTPSTGLDLLSVNVGKADFAVSDGLCKVSEDAVSEDRVLAFRNYRRDLADKVIVVRSSDNSVARVIRQSAASRYFTEGRRRIKARIIKRMGGFYSCHGLMVTLTFDPKLISSADAWRDVGYFGRSWLDNVNRWRVRNGMPRVRGIKVLEVQPGTGYPHLHYAFPRLRWLAPRDVLRRYWPYAAEGVDWRFRDSFSPSGYVCKYVSKLEGWSDSALSEIWLNRTRLYSMSRDYYLVADERPVSEWYFRRCARLSSASGWFPSLVGEYDTVLGANDIAMEVYIGSGSS